MLSPRSTTVVFLWSGVLFGSYLARAEAGITITPPAPVNTNAYTDADYDAYPQIATGGQGTWVIVWELQGSEGADIMFARSADAGTTWSAPQRLNTNTQAVPRENYDPSIATDGQGNWVVVWPFRATLGGPFGDDFDVMVSHSDDDAQTWSPTLPLNANAALDIRDDLDPSVATDGHGSWLVAWMVLDPATDPYAGDSDVLFARSTDNGASWSSPLALNSNAGSDAGGDVLSGQNPIAANGQGSWIAVWTSTNTPGGTVGTDRDIWYSTSADNASTWSAALPLNDWADSDSANDQSPSVTADSQGNWVVTWGSNYPYGGTPDASHDICIKRAVGGSWLPAVCLNTIAGLVNSVPGLPAIAADRQARLLLVWHSDGSYGNDFDILYSQSGDSGITWTAVAPLNTNAPLDTGLDFFPALATNADGTWIATWGSYDSLGGTIGTEGDVLFARLIYPDCNSNGVPDACDTNCNAAGGTCDVMTCGTSFDCNANGVPDECDIANCPPDDPSCQDCNGNGVPDRCEGWQLRSTVVPSPRFEHAMAYDSDRRVTVLFGGTLWNSTDGFGDTWEWDGATWTERTPSPPQPSPSPRFWQVMAYDSTHRVTVLFGGISIGYCSFGYCGDTWEWDGTTWTQRSNTGPAPRYIPSMAYDSGRNVTVLFGGYNGTFSYGDTWEWDGAAWTLVHPGDPSGVDAPAPRHGFAMAYDSARGVTVLFGGRTHEPPTDFGDTWEWDGMSWVRRCVDCEPAPRHRHEMAFDSVRQVSLMFGGKQGHQFSGYFGDTWQWDGTAWTLRTTIGPSPREDPAMTFDAARGATVLFGGLDLNGVNGETWEFNPRGVTDCNANGIPDECDIANCPPGDPACADCNANGIPNECDIANCPPGDPSCQDCNNNGVPDACDLALTHELWGLDNDPDQLFRINTDNASGIPGPVLSVAIGGDVGLEYDPLLGVFYAVDGNGVTPGLLVINRVSGATEIRCPAAPNSCINVGDPGLALDPVYRKLYMVNDNDFNLFEIELATGLPILIGNSGLAPVNGNVGLAYDTTRDSLFMVRTNDLNLYRLDIVNGQASVVGAHGVSQGAGLNSLAYDPVTDLLYSLSENPPAHLYSLDPDTSLAIDIGPTSFSNMEGLAIVLESRSTDCNANGIPDECDIDEGTSVDCNENGTPDECECFGVDAPGVESPAVAKNRYLSFVPGSVGCKTALRVTLTGAPPPFEASVGSQCWVGAPWRITELSGSADSLPEPAFWAARLECTPHCDDWGQTGLIHVLDENVIPSAAYEIQAIACGCDRGVESNYSAGVSVGSSKWGDIVGGGNNQPPNGVVDFNDISSVVDKFKNSPGAPSKAQADIAPDIPDRIIDFNDIPAVVDAFRGRPYPYAGPDECP